MLNKMITAAEQGDATAQFLLGTCYLKGDGVAKDIVEAYKWLQLAVVSGSFHAGAVREIIAAKLTAAQIAEAEARAEQWRQEKAQPHLAMR